MAERRRPPPSRSNPFEAPPRGKPYLVHHIVGGVPHRGEVFAPVQVTPKSSRELGFAIDAIRGIVSRPIFREVPGQFGQIEIISTAHTKGLSKSERREFHKAEGVEKENTRIHQVSENVAQIHRYLNDHHAVLRKPEMRERLVIKLQEMITILNPNSRKKPKVNAIKRLRKAIELARGGNVMMVITALGGIHGDLGIRKSSHNIQGPRSGRTAIAHQRDIRNIMREMRVWMQETKLIMHPFSGRSIPVQDIDKAAVFCEREAHKMKGVQGEDVPPEFIEMRKDFEAAGKALRKRDIRSAKRLFSDLRTEQIKFYGRHFVLPTAILRTVIDWPSNSKKNVVFVRQAQLLGENVQFWSEKVNVAWVSPWLRVLTQLAQRLPIETQNIPLLVEARTLVEQKKYAKAKEKLLSISANVV